MRTKSSIHGRLEDMGVQIDAIENMAQRMQDDYKNTKLVGSSGYLCISHFQRDDQN